VQKYNCAEGLKAGDEAHHSPPLEGWHFAQQNVGVVESITVPTTPPLRGSTPQEGN
jgi:hypothetical protein